MTTLARARPNSLEKGLNSESPQRIKSDSDYNDFEINSQDWDDLNEDLKEESPKKYPETVLVSINAHSGIGQRQNAFIFKEKIPDSTLTIVTATSPGVCNYTFKDTVRHKNIIILNEYEDFISSSPSITYEDKPKVMKTYINSVIRELKNVDKDKNRGIYSLKTKAKVKSPDTSEYLHMFSKGHNIQYKKHNQVVMNKTYRISEQDNIDRKKMFNFENSIKLLNVDDEKDLMDVLPNMAPPGNGFATDTHILTDYLTSRGAKNIIIFDFSCSDFENEFGDRDKRANRRMMEDAFGIKNVSPPTKTGVKRTRIDTTTSPKIKKQRRTKRSEEPFYKNYYRTKSKRTRSKRVTSHKTGSLRGKTKLP